MIFYSPELNEFVLVLVIKVHLYTSIEHVLVWKYGGVDINNEMFSQYAWYWVGDF